MNIEAEHAALERMTGAELRAKHAEVFGEETRSGNKPYLVKRILWRMQANAEGGLTERARRRAEELANDAALRTTAPKVRRTGDDAPPGTPQAIPFAHGARLPLAGGNLTRQYKGREIVVHVRPRGFEYEGAIYRSLSGVAKAITGTHWNGYHFFGIDNEGRKDA